MSKISEGTRNINSYIGSFPLEIQAKLSTLRNLILEIVPNIEERFSYGMPTFFYYKNLIHFAVNNKHIGLYPSDSGVSYFKTLTSEYPTTKGAIRFNINEELPYELIKKVIQYRKEENEIKYQKS